MRHEKNVSQVRLQHDDINKQMRGQRAAVTCGRPCQLELTQFHICVNIYNRSFPNFHLTVI